MRKKVARQRQTAEPTAADGAWDAAGTSALTEALFAAEERIRATDDGHVMRARILAARFGYAADLLASAELGAPNVREDWEQLIDKSWRSASRYPTDGTAKWATLIETIAHAARQAADYARLRKPPKGKLRATPTAEEQACEDREQAKMGIRFIARDDPEFAARLDLYALAKILPMWRERRQAGTRRKRDEHLWDKVRDLGIVAGLDPNITARAVAKVYERHVLPSLPPIERRTGRSARNK